MSIHGMKLEVNRNVYFFANIRYAWLRNSPSSSPIIVMMLEAYKPHIQDTVVRWKPPINGFVKCNLHRACTGNLVPNGGAFCIRDTAGDFIYVSSFKCGL